MATILIVDGYKLLRRLYRHELERKHHVVITASTGEKALARITPDVDLVVTKIRLMKGMDGFELIGKIREIYPKMRIIINTNNHADLDDSRALVARASLIKSTNPAHLVAKIQELLDA